MILGSEAVLGAVGAGRDFLIEAVKEEIFAGVAKHPNAPRWHEISFRFCRLVH